MNNRGISNIYWFSMAIAVILVIGIAWMSTEISPLKYTTETGRQQAIIFKMYTDAEQIRNYAEESIKSAAFHTLLELGIDKNKADCFNTADFNENTFNASFSTYVNNYLEALPLETPYSDLIPPTYGPFKWERHSYAPVDPLDPSESSIESISGGNALKVYASPDGEITGLNSKYAVMYFAKGEIQLTITCDEYKNYMTIAEFGF